MELFINNKSGAPIYDQIYNQIKQQIISGLGTQHLEVAVAKLKWNSAGSRSAPKGQTTRWARRAPPQGRGAFWAGGSCRCSVRCPAPRPMPLPQWGRPHLYTGYML